jgi:ABC-type multidrug transport system fused ATPase/permease subunit
MPARLSGQVQFGLRTQLFTAFLGASWDEKAREKEGRLQELAGQQTTIAGNAILQMTNGASAALMFLALLLSAFILSPTVATIISATVLALFASLRPLSRRVRRRAAATSSASIEQGGGVAESVRMAREIEVFGVGEAERSKMIDLAENLRERYVSMRSLSRVVPVLYENAVMFLLIGGLSVLYASGTGRIATLGAVVLLLIRAATYGQQMQTSYQALGESLPYLTRVTDAIQRYRDAAKRPGERRIASIGMIEFEGVGFAYRTGEPVLRNVSFTIGRGEAIGVVGPTGAGKTTLVEILLRLREPSLGVCTVDGVRLEDIADDVWHRQIAYLPQEPHLLNATVMDNIRFFRDRIDDDAIVRAAQLAHVATDIESWPDAYQTLIGQRADAVSGGQRQRICLARALAGSPELLVLDEPTSALDAASERQIQASLRSLKGSLTLVVVAHRLTTLDLCDRVMVIGDGRLEAFAPAEELYGSNDFFRRAVHITASSAT